MLFLSYPCIIASPRRDVTSITSDVHIVRKSATFKSPAHLYSSPTINTVFEKAAITNSADSSLAHESSSPQITGESAKPNSVVNAHTDEELLFQSHPVSPNRYKSSPSG